MLEKYPQDVNLVFKNFPLRNHKFAQPAAIATLAADRQGKFWEFHDKLFENFNKLNDAKIKELAGEVGLDMVRFEKDLQDEKLRQKMMQDVQEGQKAGVRGTPTIFVNGRKLKNRSVAGFSKIIDSELKKLKK